MGSKPRAQAVACPDACSGRGWFLQDRRQVGNDGNRQRGSGDQAAKDHQALVQTQVVGQPAQAQNRQNGAQIAGNQVGGRQAGTLMRGRDTLHDGHAAVHAQAVAKGGQQHAQNEQQRGAGPQIDQQGDTGQGEGQQSHNDAAFGRPAADQQLKARGQEQNDPDGKATGGRAVPRHHLRHEAGGQRRKQTEHGKGAAGGQTANQVGTAQMRGG